MASDASPEHLMDVFRTAALSVTKLYKSSIDAQKKARAEGYQDCLDDLLRQLDKEHLGLNDGEGWKIRAWANERLDTRDVSPQLDVTESDDDSEKPDTVSSPDMQRSTSTASPPQGHETKQLQPQHQQQPYLQTIVQEPQPELPNVPSGDAIVVDEPDFLVPSQDTFEFRSSLVYPQDPRNNLNLASLHLSDSNRPCDHTTSHSSTPRKQAIRRTGGGRTGRSGRASNYGPTHLGPRTGSKRPMELSEFFDVTNVNHSGPPSKRRQK